MTNIASSVGDEDTKHTRERYSRFLQLLIAAFDELHGMVLERIADPNQYFSNHADYPTMSISDSGFPIFHDTGFYRENARKNYTEAVKPSSLMGAFLRNKPDYKFPAADELIEFLKTDGLGKAFNITAPFEDMYVGQLLAQTVESYIQRFGTGPLDKSKKRRLLRRVFRGVLAKSLDLRVVVPITLTHFDLAHFKLSDTAYVTRIPRQIQLSRSMMNTSGSGAVQHVVGAATHAFVSTNWEIEIETRNDVRSAMNRPPQNIIEEVDLFFAALRAATGIRTGYAQILMIPRGVDLDLYCDLPVVYGSTYRRYPSDFDNFGWAYTRDTVTKNHALEIRRIYGLILKRRERSLTLALRRLNLAMSRDDAADAILDATIGIELLLGDKENMAISYKLRMRAGALAKLKGERTSAEVAEEVKRIYAIRSEVVHGLNAQTKQGKKAVAPDQDRYAVERNAATDILRYIIDILLEYPKYLNPLKIDAELMLGGPPPLPDKGDELEVFTHGEGTE